ncbi:MAG: hypothetical protein H7242_07805 [Microbacteriaceae bacterium]|nr:hypothetical protein [Burkholderiaceae bacterium]
MAADPLSWKVRREEILVGAFNVFSLFLSLFFLASWPTGTPVSWLVIALSLVLLWLFFVAWVQKRQLKTSLQAAFFGALMQLTCFVWALFTFFLILVFPSRALPWWNLLLWLVTALLTYALLALFRPTIGEVWSAVRQNSGKNRRVR